jgi:hypothetical protein
MPQEVLEMSNEIDEESSYLAIIVRIEHLSPMQQVRLLELVAGQLNDFVLSLAGGYLGSVIILNGFMQLTLHCDDPDQAKKDFHSQVGDGEITFHIYHQETPWLIYAAVGQGDPAAYMTNVINEASFEDYFDHDVLQIMAIMEEAAQQK